MPGGREGTAVLVEYAQVAHEWFQAGPESGGGDDDVGPEATPVTEDDVEVGEMVDLGNDLQPTGFEVMDETAVDSGSDSGGA